MPILYLDNAASTKMARDVITAYYSKLDKYYNPESMYASAFKLKQDIEDARADIAEMIGADSPDEIYFTSGGCEGNSWALFQRSSIASILEHDSIVSNVVFGAKSDGTADLDDLKAKIGRMPKDKKYQGVVSLQYVNNELGTIQPIQEAAEIAHSNGKLFHSDFVQALPHMIVNVKDLGVDMMTASAHKFYGAKGVGFVYIKKGIDMPVMIHGGSQEHGLRGGTSNYAGIIAMRIALRYVHDNLTTIDTRTSFNTLKIYNALSKIDGVHFNIDPCEQNCINSLLSVRIDDVAGSDFVVYMSSNDICLSTGSACHSGNAKPSKVLKAIGLTDKEALSTVRISLSVNNSNRYIDIFCEELPNYIETARKMNKRNKKK